MFVMKRDFCLLAVFLTFLVSAAPAALDFYRRTLTASADGSVTICTVGFLDNVAELLDSPARRVFADWPTELAVSGWELGETIRTGMRLIALPDDGNPVRDAFAIARSQDGRDRHGRQSWDVRPRRSPVPSKT